LVVGKDRFLRKNIALEASVMPGAALTLTRLFLLAPYARSAQVYGRGQHDAQGWHAIRRPLVCRNTKNA
jgi:hypothetical protein